MTGPPATARPAARLRLAAPPAGALAFLAFLAFLALLVLVGCAGGPGGTAAGMTATASPEASHPPVTGGACLLLGDEVIGQHLQLDLPVAATRTLDHTHACVRRPEAGPVPELVLTITPATVDVPTFVEHVKPPGATAVSELGKAGYHGPGLEVGWLSGDDRLLSLTLTPPAGADPDRFAAGLLDLARAVDRARN
jgi:hypothetical protein